METKKKISLAVLGAMCCLEFGGTVMAASEDELKTNLSVSALSKFVRRGFAYSKDSLVLQPSATASYKGFSANLWGNEDTDLYSADPSASTHHKWTETDGTLAYAITTGPVDLSAGYIYYGLNDASDTQEVFGRASLRTLLTPTLTAYRDVDNLPGWYVTLGVSHSMPIMKAIDLNLGAQVGYLDADDASSFAEVNNPTKAYRGLHDGLLSASVTIPVGNSISVTPGVNYSFPLTSDAADLIKARTTFSGDHHEFLYGGVTVAMVF